MERAAYAFLLSEALRPGAPGSPPPAPPPDSAVLFTTYHPLLVESHYSVLACLLCHSPPGVRPCHHGCRWSRGLSDLSTPALDGPSGVRRDAREACGRLAHRHPAPFSYAPSRSVQEWQYAHRRASHRGIPGTHFFASCTPFSPLSCKRLGHCLTLTSPSSSASHSALPLVPPTPSPFPAPALHGNVDLRSHSIAGVTSSHPSRSASARAQNRMRSRSGSSIICMR